MLSSIPDNIFGSHTYLYNHLGYLNFERTIDSDGNMISDTTYSYDLNDNILTNGNITTYYYSGDSLASEINNSYYKYYHVFQLCMKRFV